MKTSRPISSISYNTREFLVNKLDSMIESLQISFWCFVEHKADQDDKKDHIHLYLEPNKALDSMKLQLCFNEVVLGNKPLGCLPFRFSKFEDWYLYSIHNKDYLLSKGLTRTFHYDYDDVITSSLIGCREYLQYNVQDIDLSKYVPFSRIIKAVQNRVPFQELIRNGLVRKGDLFQSKLAYEILQGKTKISAYDEMEDIPEFVDLSNNSDYIAIDDNFI